MYTRVKSSQSPFLALICKNMLRLFPLLYLVFLSSFLPIKGFSPSSPITHLNILTTKQSNSHDTIISQKLFLSPSSNSEVDVASKNLLSLLLNRNKSKDDVSRIKSLVEYLQKSESYFDPDVCLNGPLYAVMYQSGPKPFWEKLDFGFSMMDKKRFNVKGQKYTKISNGVYDVRNYAEVLGRNFRVEATGICKKDTDVKVSITESAGESTAVGLFYKFISGLFKEANKRSSSLNKCPADYIIQASGVSINILGNKFQVDIKGTGYMRLLYADNNLRILTVREDTRSTGNTVDEKLGLTVVQVRVDLVDPEFTLSS